jgi:DNA-binding winged helix-turn-helix (wHTH) protein/tetratricopeptide (TPR) repeat protein
VIYRFADFELDTERYELRCDGVARHVEPQVFDVLAYLLAHRERVVTREELLAQVWGHSFVSEATLSSRLMAARKAIGDSGKTQSLIKTIRGRGYQFVGAVAEPAASTVSAPTVAVRPKQAVNVAGRGTELAHLHRLLDAALGGARQFVLVTGDAGVGKTTLVEHFVAEATSATPLLEASGRCLEHRGPAEPYMPVLEALARLCRTPESKHVAATLSRLAPTWLSEMPGLPDTVSLDVDEPAVGARPERMLREMAEALEALSTAVPVLLVLDDLHWADSSTLALLAHVARQSDPARLLMIGTARPVAGGPVDGLRRELRPRGKCVELALPLLGLDDVQTYLEDRQPGAESLASVVHQRTDGNPLFIDCLLRWWVDTGVLDPQDGLWYARKDERVLARDVPDTLRELLEQDFERLTADEQRLLEAASVVGPDFSAAAVAAGLHLDVEGVEVRCADLARRAHFLRERGAEEWPDGTVAAAFTFVHDLHRQVLYERIPAGQLARLHGDVAKRLESGYGAQASQRAAELAAHYLEAREPATAVDYLRLAAERALTRGGHSDAVHELTTALDLVVRAPALPDRDRRELSLQTALSGALVATEGWSSVSAEQAYRRGLELARHLGDDRAVAALLYELAALHEYRGDYPGSEALVAEALRVESAAGDAARLLEAHELMACSLFHQGSFGAAVEQAERGLALREPGQLHPAPAFHGEDPAVSCNDWAGLALWCLGHPDQALERITGALEMAGESGREYSLANASMHAARLHQLRGEPEDALAHAEAAAALASERGFAYQAAAGLILQGWALAQLGHEEGVERMREGLDAHRATGAEMDRPYFLALFAEAWQEGGRPEEGLSTIADAMELLSGDRAFFYEAELHRLRATLILDARGAGGVDEATASLEDAVEVARGQGARSLELRAALSLAGLQRERGVPQDAVEVLREPCQWFGEQVGTPDLDRARALLAELEEETARAARR